MKDQALCLYWPMYDRALNVNKVKDGIRLQIKFDMRSEIEYEMSSTQVRLLKAWMKENNI